MNNIRDTHCQACGSTSPENVGHAALARGDGYTACCNERAVSRSDERNWLTGEVESCENSQDCSHR